MNPHKDRLGYRDNFFSEEGFRKLAQYAADVDYYFGETDDFTTPPTGLCHRVKKDSDIWDMLTWRIEELCPFVEGMDPYLVVINCFAPRELPYFHPDGEEGVTFIYYVNPWDKDDGGETQILIGDEIRAYPPLANRMVWFDATLWHKATSRRNGHRFAYAIKYM